MKYLGINLPKETKDLYSENYKTLVKKIKNDIIWKDILCSCTGRIDFVKITILPKAIHRFNAISMKLPKTFFTELGQQQQNLKILWRYKGTWIAKTI